MPYKAPAEEVVRGFSPFTPDMTTTKMNTPSAQPALSSSVDFSVQEEDLSGLFKQMLADSNGCETDGFEEFYSLAIGKMKDDLKKRLWSFNREQEFRLALRHGPSPLKRKFDMEIGKSPHMFNSWSRSMISRGREGGSSYPIVLSMIPTAIEQFEGDILDTLMMNEMEVMMQNYVYDQRRYGQLFPNDFFSFPVRRMHATTWATEAWMMMRDLAWGTDQPLYGRVLDIKEKFADKVPITQFEDFTLKAIGRLESAKFPLLSQYEEYKLITGGGVSALLMDLIVNADIEPQARFFHHLADFFSMPKNPPHKRMRDITDWSFDALHSSHTVREVFRQLNFDRISKYAFRQVLEHLQCEFSASPTIPYQFQNVDRLISVYPSIVAGLIDSEWTGSRSVVIANTLETMVNACKERVLKFLDTVMMRMIIRANPHPFANRLDAIHQDDYLTTLMTNRKFFGEREFNIKGMCKLSMLRKENVPKNKSCWQWYLDYHRLSEPHHYEFQNKEAVKYDEMVIDHLASASRLPHIITVGDCFDAVSSWKTSGGWDNEDHKRLYARSFSKIKSRLRSEMDNIINIYGAIDRPSETLQYFTAFDNYFTMFDPRFKKMALDKFLISHIRHPSHDSHLLVDRLFHLPEFYPCLEEIRRHYVAVNLSCQRLGIRMNGAGHDYTKFDSQALAAYFLKWFLKLDGFEDARREYYVRTGVIKFLEGEKMIRAYTGSLMLTKWQPKSKYHLLETLMMTEAPMGFGEIPVDLTAIPTMFKRSKEVYDNTAKFASNISKLAEKAVEKNLVDNVDTLTRIFGPTASCNTDDGFITKLLARIFCMDTEWTDYQRRRYGLPPFSANQAFLNWLLSLANPFNILLYLTYGIAYCLVPENLRGIIVAIFVIHSGIASVMVKYIFSGLAFIKRMIERVQNGKNSIGAMTDDERAFVIQNETPAAEDTFFQTTGDEMHEDEISSQTTYKTSAECSVTIASVIDAMKGLPCEHAQHLTPMHKKFIENEIIINNGFDWNTKDFKALECFNFFYTKEEDEAILLEIDPFWRRFKIENLGHHSKEMFPIAEQRLYWNNVYLDFLKEEEIERKRSQAFSAKEVPRSKTAFEVRDDLTRFNSEKSVEQKEIDSLYAHILADVAGIFNMTTEQVYELCVEKCEQICDPAMRKKITAGLYQKLCQALRPEPNRVKNRNERHSVEQFVNITAKQYIADGIKKHGKLVTDENHLHYIGEIVQTMYNEHAQVEDDILQLVANHITVELTRLWSIRAKKTMLFGIPSAVAAIASTFTGITMASITGVIPTGSNMAEVLNKAADNGFKLHKLRLGLTAVNEWWAWLKELIEQIFIFCVQQVSPEDGAVLSSARKHPILVKFVEDVLFYANKYRTEPSTLSVQDYQAVQDLVAQYSDIVSELAAAGNRTLSSYFASIKKDLDMLVSISTPAVEALAGKQVAPVLYVAGPPGVGKTQMTGEIVRRLTERIKKAVYPTGHVRAGDPLFDDFGSSYCFTYGNGTSHCDGYRRQPIMVINDYGQYLQKDSFETALIMQAGDNYAGSLPMARIEDKGMSNSSAFLFVTSNVRFPQPMGVNAVSQPEAIIRRLNIHVLATIVGNRGDAPNCKYVYNPHSEAGLAALHNYQTRMGMKISNEIVVAEMIDSIGTWGGINSDIMPSVMSAENEMDKLVVNGAINWVEKKKKTPFYDFSKFDHLMFSDLSNVKPQDRSGAPPPPTLTFDQVFERFWESGYQNRLTYCSKVSKMLTDQLEGAKNDYRDAAMEAVIGRNHDQIKKMLAQTGIETGAIKGFFSTWDVSPFRPTTFREAGVERNHTIVTDLENNVVTIDDIVKNVLWYKFNGHNYNDDDIKKFCKDNIHRQIDVDAIVNDFNVHMLNVPWVVPASNYHPYKCLSFLMKDEMSITIIPDRLAKTCEFVLDSMNVSYKKIMEKIYAFFAARASSFLMLAGILLTTAALGGGYVLIGTLLRGFGIELPGFKRNKEHYGKDDKDYPSDPDGEVFSIVTNISKRDFDLAAYWRATISPEKVLSLKNKRLQTSQANVLKTKYGCLISAGHRCGDACPCGECKPVGTGLFGGKCDVCTTVENFRSKFKVTKKKIDKLAPWFIKSKYLNKKIAKTEQCKCCFCVAWSKKPDAEKQEYLADTAASLIDTYRLTESTRRNNARDEIDFRKLLTFSEEKETKTQRFDDLAAIQTTGVELETVEYRRIADCAKSPIDSVPVSMTSLMKHTLTSQYGANVPQVLKTSMESRDPNAANFLRNNLVKANKMLRVWDDEHFTFGSANCLQLTGYTFVGVKHCFTKPIQSISIKQGNSWVDLDVRVACHKTKDLCFFEPIEKHRGRIEMGKNLLSHLPDEHHALKLLYESRDVKMSGSLVGWDTKSNIQLVYDNLEMKGVWKHNIRYEGADTVEFSGWEFPTNSVGEGYSGSPVVLFNTGVSAKLAGLENAIYTKLNTAIVTPVTMRDYVELTKDFTKTKLSENSLVLTISKADKSTRTYQVENYVDEGLLGNIRYKVDAVYAEPVGKLQREFVHPITKVITNKMVKTPEKSRIVPTPLNYLNPENVSSKIPTTGKVLPILSALDPRWLKKKKFDVHKTILEDTTSKWFVHTPPFPEDILENAVNMIKAKYTQEAIRQNRKAPRLYTLDEAVSGVPRTHSKGACIQSSAGYPYSRLFTMSGKNPQDDPIFETNEFGESWFTLQDEMASSGFTYNVVEQRWKLNRGSYLEARQKAFLLDAKKGLQPTVIWTNCSKDETVVMKEFEYLGCKNCNQMFVNSCLKHGWATFIGRPEEVEKFRVVIEQQCKSTNLHMIEFWTERHPKDTRVFTLPGFDFKINFEMYFGDFCEMFMEAGQRLNSACGLDKFGPSWGELYRNLTAISSHGFSIDYKKFDSRMKNDVMWSVLDIVENFYTNSTEEDRRVRRAIVHEMVFSSLLVGTSVYKKFMGNPSGSPFTSIMNTIANDIYLTCGWLMACRTAKKPETPSFMRKNVWYCLMGDDSVISVSKQCLSFFNFETLKSEFTKIGLDIEHPLGTEDAPPYYPIDDQSFLGCGFKQHPSFDQVVMPILKDESVFDQIHWFKGSIRSDEQLSENIETAMHMLMPQGEVRFNEVKHAINEMLRLHGIIEYSQTYDQVMATYLSCQGFTVEEEQNRELALYNPLSVSSVDLVNRYNCLSVLEEFPNVSGVKKYHVFGGDGTINSVVSKEPKENRNVVKVLHPSGTVNMIYRSLPIGTHDIDVWQLAKGNEVFCCFLSYLSVGVDACATNVYGENRSGLSKYGRKALMVFSALGAVLHYPKITFNGECHHNSLHFQNTPFYGPGLKCPFDGVSDPSDHKIEVAYMSRIDLAYIYSNDVNIPCLSGASFGFQVHSDTYVAYDGESKKLPAGVYQVSRLGTTRIRVS